MIPNDHVLKPLIEPVEKDLNILGMNNLLDLHINLKYKVDHHTDDHYAKWGKTKILKKIGLKYIPV